MALNSTGAISLGGSTTGQSVAVELGKTATGTISLNDTVVRALASVASGAISMNNLRGKSSSPPSNTVAPAISGTPISGYSLTCSTGTWTGGGITYSYQWQRNGTNVGSNSSTYTLSDSDNSTTITCTVTGTNTAGSAFSPASNSVFINSSTSSGTYSIPLGVTSVSLMTKAADGTPGSNYYWQFSYGQFQNAYYTSGNMCSPSAYDVYPTDTATEGASIYIGTYGYYNPGRYGCEVWDPGYWIAAAANPGVLGATTTAVLNGTTYTSSGSYSTASPTLNSAISLAGAGYSLTTTVSSNGYVKWGYFADVPANPVITGTPLPGYALTSSTGRWSGSGTITYSYQWKRGAANIGTNSSSYTLTTSDVGSYITCIVTAIISGSSTSRTSNNSAYIVSSTSASVPSGVRDIYLLGKGGDGSPTLYANSYTPLEYLLGVYSFQPSFGGNYGGPWGYSYDSIGWYAYDDGSGNWYAYAVYAWAQDISRYSTNGTATTTTISTGGSTAATASFPGGSATTASPTYSLKSLNPVGYTVSTSLGTSTYGAAGSIYVGYFV
jgi:hypothetical protein